LGVGNMVTLYGKVMNLNLSLVWNIVSSSTDNQKKCPRACPAVYTVSQKNCATFIFAVTLANVGRFLKFFQCRNQNEMAHNKNEKFPTVA